MPHGRADEEKTSLKVCEDSRKRKLRRKQLKHYFFKDPFKTGKEVITPKVKSEPKVPKSVLSEFIQKVVVGPNRTVSFRNLDGLDDISMNIGKFNSEKFKISEQSQVVKKKRNASQPVPNQMPYKVYKKSPRIMNYIFMAIMFMAIRDKLIALDWRVSDRIKIPKVQNSRQSNLGDYRQIALGNVDGKLI